jgi:hypothetical protein
VYIKIFVLLSHPNKEFSMENHLVVDKDCKSCSKNCRRSFSWSGVIAGALIGIGLSFICNLFAFSIGVSVFTNPSTEPQSMAIGGMICLVIISIFTMGTAGWVAGYLSHPKCLHRDMGVIHGFSAWCVVLLAMVLMGGHVERFISHNVAELYHAPVVNEMDMSHQPATDAASNTSTASSADAAHQADVAKKVATGAFLLFVLSFLGALASCAGGHWGARSCEKDILYYQRNSDNNVPKM